MPGGFPLGQDICNGTDIGTVTATSLGTSVAASATPNTKGSYVQLVASTAADCCFLQISIYQNGYNNWGSIDIAVGAAASEVIIAADLFVPSTALATPAAYVINYFLPIAIPAGTRISARAQSSVASNANLVSAILFDGGFSQIEAAAGVDVIGFTSATSAPTILDPGTSANTKGAYVQLVASTSKDYVGFLVVLDTNKVDVGSSVNGFIDIAIGGAGSEKIIVPNMFYRRSSPLGMAVPSVSALFGINIPAGTIISARSQCITTTAADRVLGIVLHGVYQ